MKATYAILALAGAILPAPQVAVASPAAPDTHIASVEDLVASLEGGWIGQDNETPMGNMGFATLFEWQEDGSLHSRSSLNSETYIDLRFSKNEDGAWILTEEAGMEGLGVQSYSLDPLGPVDERGTHRWVYSEKPEFLTIDVGADDERMWLDVVLRGEPHVAFRLDKQPEETWPEIKRQMEASARLSPSEGVSIHDVLAARKEEGPGRTEGAEVGPDDPIAAARAEVDADPRDARARLALAQVLGNAINENPANGPRYAFEMLESLTTTIELDPGLSEAYHWLVGYYLNAPPIAGGSVDKAAEIAQRLSTFDPEGAEALLAQIAAHSSAAPATEPQ